MKLFVFLALLSVVSAVPQFYHYRYRRSAENLPEISSNEPETPSNSAPASTRQSRLLNYNNENQETPTDQQTQTYEQKRTRQNKALNFYNYVPQLFAGDDDYGDDDLTFNRNEDIEDNSDISRTIPARRKQNVYKNNFANTNSLSYDNSPIFYIRLPPTPYMFVPGLGYVSQPPSIGPPMPPPVNPFINLPIDFVSNGKPTNIYQWSGAPSYQSQNDVDPYNQVYQRPSRPSRPNYNTYQKPAKKPVVTDSKVTNLKGPYVFNGKPNDIFVLRDSYNSLYSDALQNFYP